MARPRSRQRDDRPGLVIGPTTTGADVQLQRSAPAAARRGGARVDRRIEDDIRRRLQAHSHPGLADIVVTARAGDVRLEGVVGDRATRRVAAEIADAVAGVKSVENRLTIGALKTPRRTA
jgi:osmotically-inducible protein OsmY